MCLHFPILHSAGHFWSVPFISSQIILILPCNSKNILKDNLSPHFLQQSNQRYAIIIRSHMSSRKLTSHVRIKGKSGKQVSLLTFPDKIFHPRYFKEEGRHLRISHMMHIKQWSQVPESPSTFYLCENVEKQSIFL